MHLDTVLTQIDTDKFLIHPSILDELEMFELTPGRGGAPVARRLDMPLEEALASALGVERVTLLRCGGGDQIAAQREQPPLMSALPVRRLTSLKRFPSG